MKAKDFVDKWIHDNDIDLDDIEDTYSLLISIASDLLEEVKALRYDAEALRNNLIHLCNIKPAEHSCRSCKMPMCENEDVLNFGICNRCFDKDINDDEWRKLKKRITVQMNEVPEQAREPYQNILAIIDGIRET